MTFIACAAPAKGAGATAPPWLAAVAAAPAGMKYDDAAYAVLLDDCTLQMDKTGLITRRIRWVVRVLNREGKSSAFARVGFESGSENVLSLQAWLIPPAGPTVAYTRKNAIEAAAYSNARELYGESRYLFISASDDAVPGSVFGFEASLTEKSLFAQEIWFFQQTVPVESSRLTVTLPPGWDVRSHTFNHAPIEPAVNGSARTWELRQLPAAVEEPLGPPRNAHHPWLALDFIPPSATTILRQSFSNWTEISTFFSARYDTPSAPDAAIKARADELVKGAATPWERIARLCRHAQNVNYISINLDLANAGGMTPRPAPLVFKCNYGDCKDKATLLRALLRTQGFESFPVVAYSGDATHVRPEWVSPMQFNHCILAIRVDDMVDVPAILVHPTLGRFVIFDPTNHYTPPGWLAEEDAGGHALILAGSQGALVKLPELRHAENRYERKISARLAADGSVSGTLDENFIGNASSDIREEYRAGSVSDYRKLIERWLGRSLPAARTTRLDTTDDFDRARFSLSMDFAATAYGKTMRDTLLVFKPVLVARRTNTALKKGKRTQPVVIESSSFVERTDIELPPGYGVDEAFAPVELQAPFGEYKAHAELRGNVLHFERSLELRAHVLPVDDYETARVFFEKVLRADQSPVVLKRI